MNNFVKAIIVLITVVIVLFIGFYLWFSIGLVSNMRPKTIDTTSIRLYKESLRSEFTDIKAVDVYRQAGRINFDIDADSNIALVNCKSIVKKTKEFIEAQGIANILENSNDQGQWPISIKFKAGKNNYLFECPYWIPTEDDTDNPNNSVENNYKIWFMTVNEDGTERISF